MGSKINYEKFLEELDKKLAKYFESQAEHICCKCGCSGCCEKGDYPLSELELNYLMKGYINLNYDTKIKVQENIKNIEKGGACPFLIDKKCSVYDFRPIICRTFGLAYVGNDGITKIPYCVDEGKNFSKVYKDGVLSYTPIELNLDTNNLIKESEIRSLYDWIKQSKQ